MPPKSSLASLLGELQNPTPKDFDPETADDANEANPVDSDYSDDEEQQLHNPRAHYVDVEQSGMRKKAQLSEHDSLLNSKYKGVKATRDQLYGEDESEIEGEGEGEGDQEMQDEDSDQELDSQSDEKSQEEEDEQEEEEQDEDDDQDQDQDQDEDTAGPTTIARQLRESQKLSKQLAARRVEDAEKGRHVRRQIKTWERALEVRIKAQAAMRDLNRLPSSSSYTTLLTQADAGTGTQADVVSRLMAVSGLLFELRGALTESGIKRKRDELDLDLDLDLDAAIADVLALEKERYADRRAVLDKWSSKVTSASGGPTLKAVNQSPSLQLDAALRSDALSRLLERTRVRRTTESESGSESTEREREVDPDVFDDSDFYSHLLRELIERRGAANGAGADSSVPLYGGKKKRTVDTRASKGRRLRYDVNEKIQNFMPPIHSALRWTNEQIDRLFSQLAGSADDKGETETDTANLAGLRVFG